MSESIDLTPAGLQTQEGIKRNRKAIDALSNANANLLNSLMECLTADGTLQYSLKMLGLSAEDISIVLGHADARKAATEEFLRSLTGAPPWKG